MEFVLTCWKLLCELAPWLLIGMLISGLMHVGLPHGFVKRKFQGWLGVVKAVLLGVPLPLCSCGVVPAGIGLKNQGASNGASLGFLISTPQTGVDSVLVSAAFFGWPFAIFKMMVAAITGLLGGWLAEAISESADPNSETPSYGADIATSPGSIWMRAWEHAVEIARSIWGWLVIGVVLSAVIEKYIPQAYLAQVESWGLVGAMVFVLLISLPLYVCATASVPIAAALVKAGLSPAAALVFLMAGPATNITTLGAILAKFGWRIVSIYLGTIIVCSFGFAAMFDWLLAVELTGTHAHVHDHNAWWAVGSGWILLGFLVWFALSDARRLVRRLKGRCFGNTGVIEEATELTVTGMNCGGCVSKVERIVGSQAGVEKVEVDLRAQTVRILGQASLLEICAALEAAGFQSSVK